MTDPTTPQVRDDVPVGEKRAWLKANAATTGLEVGDRGKLSHEAEVAYARQNPKPAV